MTSAKESILVYTFYQRKGRKLGTTICYVLDGIFQILMGYIWERARGHLEMERPLLKTKKQKMRGTGGVFCLSHSQQPCQMSLQPVEPFVTVPIGRIEAPPTATTSFSPDWPGHFVTSCLARLFACNRTSEITGSSLNWLFTKRCIRSESVTVQCMKYM